MSEPLGPIEIHCDAPPYAIVKAGHRIGIKQPEDVRWLRWSQFLRDQHQVSAQKSQNWKAFLGLGRSERKTCTCGEKIPVLEPYTFTFRGGREAHYYLSQCPGCRTVFWDEG